MTGRKRKKARAEFRRHKGEVTGAALVAAMQSSPSRDVEIEPQRSRMPVRDIAQRSRVD